MSDLSARNGVVDLLDRLSMASPQQRLLRALAVAGTLVLPVLAAFAAGDGVPLPAVVALVLVGLVLGLVPDSNAPLVWMLLAVGVWVSVVPSAVTWWTWAAAVDLLAVHLACTLTCYGPAPLTLPAGLLRSWAARVVLLVGATSLVWLLARVLTAADPVAEPWLLAAGLALVVGWSTYLLAVLGTRDPGS